MLDSGLSVFDSGAFTQMMRIAEVISDSSTFPDDLRGFRDGDGFVEYPAKTQIANAMRIVNAARLWDCDPFQLASMSFIIHGSLDFEGKVYAAIANVRGGLDGGLEIKYESSGDTLAAVVSASIGGKKRETPITLLEARTKNACWKNDPRQQLFYAGCRKWVRMHCPQVMLGIVTITPTKAETESLNVIEAMPESQQLLTEQAPSQDYATAMNQLKKCEFKHQAERISLGAKASNGMTKIERDKVVAAGREAWLKLPELNDDEPSESFARWERTLKTEPDREQRLIDLAEIDDDKSLSKEEKNRLAQLNAQLTTDKEPAVAS